MKENLRKFLIYFNYQNKYWKPTESDASLVVSPGLLGRYPLDLVMRLEEDHYTHFDSEGLPVRFTHEGHTFHNYTTLCS